MVLRLKQLWNDFTGYLAHLVFVCLFGVFLAIGVEYSVILTSLPVYSI